MENSKPGIGQAFNAGVEGFKKNPVIVIAGVLIYMVITAVLSAIPVVGPLASIFLMPALAGGYILFFLKFARGEEGSLEDLFAGFQKYTTFLGAYWLLVLYMVLFGIPGIILLAIGLLIGNCFGWFLAAVGYVGWLVLIVIFALKWVFNMYVIADDWNEGRIMPAFEKSAKLTEGRMLELFLVLLVLGLFAAAGILVLFVGVFVTGPIAGIGTAAYYLALKKEYLAKIGEAPESAPEPEPQATPAPEPAPESKPDQGPDMEPLSPVDE